MVLALGFSSSALAVDEPDWVQISETADIKVNVNGDQTTGTGVGIQTPGTDIGSGDQVIYVSGKNITGGANASAGMMATGGKKAQVDKGGSIYVEGNGGYASGLSAGWGQQNQILNKGTIYVKGTGDDKVKGMSVDDGFAQNQGTIYVWDALGMVSNTQGNANTNRLKNQGTIEVYGGAGMVDNNSNNTTEKVLITNQGTINVQDGDGIRVSESSTRGETVIHNEGTINAAEGANAINVESASHEINIRLEAGADINGTIKVASDKKSGLNQTRLTVDNAGEQDVSLDASYLEGLYIDNSQLTIGNTGDLTIADYDLQGDSSRLTFDEVGGVITINLDENDDTSKIDFGGNAVAVKGDWTINYRETQEVADLTYDSDPSTQFTLTNNGTLHSTGEIYIGNETFVNNGWDLAAVEPSDGVVYAKSLTLSGHASFTNTGRVDVAEKVIDRGFWR